MLSRSMANLWAWQSNTANAPDNDAIISTVQNCSLCMKMATTFHLVDWCLGDTSYSQRTNRVENTEHGCREGYYKQELKNTTRTYFCFENTHLFQTLSSYFPHQRIYIKCIWWSIADVDSHFVVDTDCWVPACGPQCWSLFVSRPGVSAHICWATHCRQEYELTTFSTTNKNQHLLSISEEEPTHCRPRK